MANKNFITEKYGKVILDPKGNGLYGVYTDNGKVDDEYLGTIVFADNERVTDELVSAKINYLRKDMLK